MGAAGVMLLAAGLSMDAFAVSVCKGLSLNDSYWVVPEGFEGGFSQYLSLIHI